MTKTEHLKVLQETIIEIYESHKNLASEKGWKGLKDECYIKNPNIFSYIPSNHYLLKAAFEIFQSHFTKTEQRINILDVGCGDCLFIKYFSHLLKTIDVKHLVFGIEINRLLNEGLIDRGCVLDKNIHDVSDQYFKEKQFIYLYNPVKNRDEMFKILERLCNICVKDTLIVFANACVPNQDLVKIGFKNHEKTSVFYNKIM